MPHTVLIGAREANTPTQTKPSFVMVTNAQIATLQQQALDLAATIDSVNQTLQSVQDQIKTLTEAEEFDVFIMNELVPFFGESTAENIVKMLQKCRLNGNSYIYFNPVYQWKGIYGDLQKRQLLKLVSAVYRVKYSQKNANNIYTLKSDIKYAKACPECGAIAATFYNRLASEGLI